MNLENFNLNLNNCNEIDKDMIRELRRLINYFNINILEEEQTYSDYLLIFDLYFYSLNDKIVHQEIDKI